MKKGDLVNFYSFKNGCIKIGLLIEINRTEPVAYCSVLSQGKVLYVRTSHITKIAI